jgi:hypothetical protein
VGYQKTTKDGKILFLIGGGSFFFFKKSMHNIVVAIHSFWLKQQNK